MTIAPASLRPVLPGLLFAVATLLFGFGLGIVFGFNEAIIKDKLAADAAAVVATAYAGDTAAAKAVVDKSWSYMQRAHLHAGATGTTAVALMLVLVGLGVSARTTRLLGLALGVGALGYSVFWLWAGFRAPGLGSTGAAKESLSWLAMPSSGLVVAATLAVFLLLCYMLLGGRTRTSAPSSSSVTR
jgi:hypothetical protein